MYFVLSGGGVPALGLAVMQCAFPAPERADLRVDKPLPG
jgi:hypothetical protein